MACRLSGLIHRMVELIQLIPNSSYNAWWYRSPWFQRFFWEIRKKSVSTDDRFKSIDTRSDDVVFKKMYDERRGKKGWEFEVFDIMQKVVVMNLLQGLEKVDSSSRFYHRSSCLLLLICIICVRKDQATALSRYLPGSLVQIFTLNEGSWTNSSRDSLSRTQLMIEGLSKK